MQSQRSAKVEAWLQRAREGARRLAVAPTETRNAALEHISRAIGDRTQRIVAANAIDLSEARDSGMQASMLDRLALDARRIDAIADAVLDVVRLEDPLGERRALETRPNGLKVYRQRIPLGVLGVVYEARPNVTIEAATLAIKSGNAVILRGGKEALRSNFELSACVAAGLERAGLPSGAVVFVDDPAREHVVALLGAVGGIDLVIPRGGDALMRLVDEHARVPVIRHGTGITHMYIDEGARPDMAEALAFNSKVQRPGVCNALETLLVHRSHLENGALVRVARHLAIEGGVELRVDPDTARVLHDAGVPANAATPPDWDTEFLRLTLAVRVVADLDEAMEHVARHGSHHTAVIVSEDESRAQKFLREVDASCVLWNASSRFNDGGQLGLGAEMGISTSKMHAYGPMGLRELTAEKFVVVGSGQVRGG